MQKIEIIHKPTDEKPFLIIYKPKGLPSAPLYADDSDNALAQAVIEFPALAEVKGRKEIEHGLLHRLDNATDGLLIIAATQECYDFLMTEQEAGRITKTYSAECDIIKNNAELLEGFPPDAPSLPEVTSYFRPYGEGRKEVRPVTEKSCKAALSKLGKPKLYTTNIQINKISETKALATCKITNGYRHQVRCHLAWAGFPVSSDQLYNSKDKKKAENLLKFSATSICFEYPRGDLNSYDRKDTWT